MMSFRGKPLSSADWSEHDKKCAYNMLKEWAQNGCNLNTNEFDFDEIFDGTLKILGGQKP